MSPNPKKATARRRQCAIAIATTSVTANAALVAASIYHDSSIRRPYHTSPLSGAAWVRELLVGNNNRMRENLGLGRRAFRRLVTALEDKSGLRDSHRGVTTNEQVAIFLYTVTGDITIRKVADRFQRSTSTVSHYFHACLDAILEPAFYNAFIRLPGKSTPLSDRIAQNPKFAEFFSDCLGAIDGSHFYARVAPDEHVRYRDRHANISQNVLAVCSFDELFTYIMSGWEGSASDSLIFGAARRQSLGIPEGKYVLGDAGFPHCLAVLVPYRGERYHLSEWGRANERPRNPRELFNLRHAQLRNVIERIIGILKKSYRIFRCVSPEFNKTTQTKLVPALAALHNFRRLNNDLEGNDWNPETKADWIITDPFSVPVAESFHECKTLLELTTDNLSIGISQEEAVLADARRDEIAARMWAAYQECVGQM